MKQPKDNKNLHAYYSKYYNYCQVFRLDFEISRMVPGTFFQVFASARTRQRPSFMPKMCAATEQQIGFVPIDKYPA